jgi:hypothetical protein
MRTNKRIRLRAVRRESQRQSAFNGHGVRQASQR